MRWGLGALVVVWAALGFSASLSSLACGAEAQRALSLAQRYAPGMKQADAARALAELERFFSACPGSTDALAQRLLRRVGSPDLRARVAADLRARLAGETDLHVLLEYSILWGLEFQTHDPREYGDLRAQVAYDLKRLASANAKPDAAWLVFLKDGYVQSGASAEVIRAAEQQVIDAFPHSEEAYEIASSRWEQAHPEPQDAAGWAQYHAERLTAVKAWRFQFTGSARLQHEELFRMAEFDPDLPADEGLRAVNDYLSYSAAQEPASFENRFWPAFVLVDHNWQPQRVFDLLRDSDQWLERRQGNHLSAEAEEMLANNEIIQRQAVAGVWLVAARLTEQPAKAEKFKLFIERPLPEKSWPAIERRYWLNRGRLAALEGRRADALHYYQKALWTKVRAPEAIEGRVFDDLTDEARVLWKQTGGTETEWDVWSKPPATHVREAVELGWKVPGKAMPPFELADLSGKVWRLKEFAGRTVLINVWATWCGPCMRELPHLQKLYEAVKGRADVQIFTINIDEQPAMLADFLKKRGFTFPVAPGAGFVEQVLDLVAIPQNWIVDANGVWRWTGSPNVPETEWETATLKQMELVH